MYLFEKKIFDIDLGNSGDARNLFAMNILVFVKIWMLRNTEPRDTYADLYLIVFANLGISLEQCNYYFINEIVKEE